MTTATDPVDTGTARLTAHRYGKSGVRVAKIEREADHHVFHDLTVRLWLEGDFSGAYLRGDNTTTLPTDTMRATAFALAEDGSIGETERYLERVLEKLLASTPAATAAHAEAVIHAWDRISVGGTPHPHAFKRANGDGTAAVSLRRDGAVTVTSGITDLSVLKTTGSEYQGFLRDDFTVLAETADRVIATSVEATWTWRTEPTSFAAARAAALAALERAFATHHSLAVQHTLFATGEAVLAAVPEIAEVSLRMPNRHHVPVDLQPFGRENSNSVLVVLDRPYGVIEGTISR
jgi:urate oxidase